MSTDKASVFLVLLKREKKGMQLNFEPILHHFFRIILRVLVPAGQIPVLEETNKFFVARVFCAWSSRWLDMGGVHGRVGE